MNWLDDFAEFLQVPEVTHALHPGASAADLKRIEGEIAIQPRAQGFKWPPSYRDFMLHWDGGKVEDDDDENGAFVAMLRSGSDVKEWETLMSLNGAGTVLVNHEIETYFGFEPLVFIGQNEGGDFWALDPGQTDPEGEMPVLYCDHETGKTYRQAENFCEFIGLLVQRKLCYRGFGYS